MPRLLETDEITRQLLDLPGWRFADGSLRRSISAASFPTAVSIVDAIATAAEDMDHHPDIDIRWRTVHLTLSTHSEGGVTQFDIELAHRISAIAADHGVHTDDALDRKPRLEIGIDCHDAGTLRPWWATALRYVDHDGVLVDPEGSGPAVWFQEVPEEKSVKNRLHLDLHLPRHEAAAKRDLLVSLGGTLIGAFETFWVLADPEGNELCVCADD
ncbi:MAG: 4a-hydroxytetrahydrobiopterin dehydratase [Actinomycetes bacterium]